MTSKRVPGELVYGLTRETSVMEAVRTAVDFENMKHRKGKLIVLCTGRGEHKPKLVMRAYWLEASRATVVVHDESKNVWKLKPSPDECDVVSTVGLVDLKQRVRFLPYIEADMSEEVKHKYPANVSTEEVAAREVGIEFPGFEFECPTCKPRNSAKFSQLQLSKLVLQKLLITGQSRGPLELDISSPQDMGVLPALKPLFDELGEGARLEAGLKHHRTRS
ncbi:hypothetical protein CJ193_003530 [Pseudoglutamicibacter albus]|uniref:hypothetical protein n=1 Tax=Pseudoglutamicibacter albus TaxID=98671 RepID=UPI000C78957B|nr:hypothetical protein [Pseudoglutamicibacter albus]PKY80825.1 hypothetical protein CYJ35_03615 [Pseudoglutamicibacter albus]WIK84913.1 hypothetical protein CJ193_003530 [Pseudoglutamicibacter albus]